MARVDQVRIVNAVGAGQLLCQTQFLATAELHAAGLCLVPNQANERFTIANGADVRFAGRGRGHGRFALRLLKYLGKRLGATVDTGGGRCGGHRHRKYRGGSVSLG